MAKFDARNVLLATHRQRNIDRSTVGLWLANLNDEGRDRFAEYVAAFGELHPQISTPTFSDAVRRDPILGENWPKISGESLKKWLSRARPDGEEPPG